MSGRLGMILLAGVLFFVALAGVVALMRRNVSPGPPIPDAALPAVSNPAPQGVSLGGQPSKEEPSGIRVEVADTKGAPIEGARAYDAMKYDAVLASTDESGVMVVAESSLNAGRGLAHPQMRVEHDRFAPETVQVLRGSRRLRVVMTSQAVLTLRVMNERHEPLANAKVQVYECDNGWDWPAWYRDRNVDANGEIRIADVRPGAIVLRAFAPGYENQRHIVLTRAGESRSLTIVLKPGKVLNVIVRDMGGLPSPTPSCSRATVKEEGCRERSSATKP
jgi:hypothetical protein